MPLIVPAQNLSGKWTGQIKKRVNGRMQQFYFEVNLNHQDKAITGASLLAINDTTTITTLIRGTWSNQELNYKELNIIKVRGGINRANLCLKQCAFRYEHRGDTEVLIGNWTGKTNLDEWCSPGIIQISRPAASPPPIPTAKEEVVKKPIVHKVNIALEQPDMVANIEVIRNADGEQVYQGLLGPSGLDLTLKDGIYHVWIYKKGFLYVQQEETLPTDNLNWHYQLSKIEAGNKFVIEGLYFERSQSSITESSKPALLRLIRFLQDNPGCKIRIVGHTDDIGNAYNNRILSLNRARAIAKYLINEANIPIEQLSPPEGRGGDEPLIDTGRLSGDLRNRRVEVEIVEITE